MVDLNRLMKGSFFLTKTENGHKAERFTKKQLEFYAKTADGYRIRADSTAGIRMEFKTTQLELSFDYKTTGFCRDALYFDVYENDVLCGIVKESDNSIGGRFYYKKQSQGSTKITIYFSQNCDIHISNLCLGEIEYIEDQKLNYLAIGDSITQGMDANSPSLTYPAIIARYFNLNFYNHGVGGFCFDPESLDDEIPFKPDIITVAYGVNDAHQIHFGSRTQEKVFENITLFLDKLKQFYKKASINVILPIWCKGETEDPILYGVLNKTRNFISEEALKRGIHVIDGRKLVPNHSDFFGDERLHPNEMGFLEYAMNLTKEIVSH